jgi:hypothetical protein
MQIWRSQITWDRWREEVYRHTPPLPEPIGERRWWEELWEQEKERYREEDGKEWERRREWAKSEVE